MLTWQKYCDECKKWGMTNLYQDEAAFNRAYGIAETIEPLVIMPKRDARKVSARFENHVESTQKPKPKACNKKASQKKRGRPPLDYA